MSRRHRSDLVTLATCFALCLPGAAAAQPDPTPQTPRCVKLPGLLAGPFVPNEKSALAVFLAVEEAIHPSADKVGFPEVTVWDQGAYWSVFRTRPPAPQPPAESDEGTGVTSLILSAGGGQLEMRIDKCSGKISHAHYSR